MEKPSLQHNFHHDDSIEDMVERVRSLYGIEQTNLDQLRMIADKEPGSEHLEVFLDDLTYEALQDNEQFNANRKKITAGGLSSDAQLKIRDEQRSLFNQYRGTIIEAAGLSADSGMTELDKSKQQVRSIINGKINAEGDNRPKYALEALGIITHDADGKDIFTYPRGIFPKSTDTKWDTYLETVKDHLRKERALHNGTIDKSQVGEADTMRRMAHNAVTRDVHEILGLDLIEGSNWDFEKTRNLLAKMRDNRFPTVKTAEKFMTEEAILEGTIGMHALRMLNAKLADLHKQQS